MSIKDRDTIFLAKLALLAIITRLLFALSYHIAFILSSNGPQYAPDGEFYSTAAWYIALILKGVIFQPLSIAHIPPGFWINDSLIFFIGKFSGKLPPMESYGIGLFSYIMGFFYYIFGYTPILFRFLNIIVSVVTALLCYGLAKDVFNKTVARTSFVLMLLLPSQFIYSASLLRDTVVNFFVMLFIYSIFMLKKIDKPAINARRVLCIFISFALIFLLRELGIFPIIASLLLCAAVLFYRRYRWLFTTVTVLLLLGVIISGVPFNDYVRSKLTEPISRHVAFASYRGSFYKLLPDQFYYPAISVTFPQLLGRDIALAYLKGIKSFLLEPLPFRGLKLSDTLVLPEIILWYVIVIFSLVGIFRSPWKADIRIAGLIAFLSMFSFMISITGANIEALIRHRGMIIPVYCIFAAYGYSIIGRKGHTITITG